VRASPQPVYQTRPSVKTPASHRAHLVCSTLGITAGARWVRPLVLPDRQEDTYHGAKRGTPPRNANVMTGFALGESIPPDTAHVSHHQHPPDSHLLDFLTFSPGRERVTSHMERKYRLRGRPGLGHRPNDDRLSSVRISTLLSCHEIR